MKGNLFDNFKINYSWAITVQLFLLLFFSNTYGQGLCDKSLSGEIEIKNSLFTTFCGVPYKVELAPNLTAKNAKYVFDYKNENDFSKLKTQTSPIFTYNNAGQYTILQYGVINGKETYACKNIQIYEKKLPNIDLYSCDGQKAELLIKNESINKFDDFLISWGDGTPFTSQLNLPIGESKITKIYPIKKDYDILIYGYRKSENIYGTITNTPGCTETTGLNLDLNDNNTKPPKDISVSISKSNRNNAIVNIFDYPSKKEYEFLRVIDNKPFVSNKNTVEITDKIVSNQQVCFKVASIDQCNRKSLHSDKICTINLKLNNDKLEWSKEKVFTDALSTYFLIKYDRHFQEISRTRINASEIDFILMPTDLNENYFFQLLAVSSKNRESLSNIVETQPIYKLFVPNSFTPNQDQSNDLLKIDGSHVIEINQTVYDRYSNIVFESSSVNEFWNGGLNNDLSKPLSNGIYRLSVLAKYDNDKTEKSSYSILLIR